MLYLPSDADARYRLDLEEYHKLRAKVLALQARERATASADEVAALDQAHAQQLAQLEQHKATIVANAKAGSKAELITVLSFCLLIVLWFVVPVGWDKLPRVFVHEWARVAAAAGCVLLGWGFFYLRSKVRWFYALLELGLACYAAYRSAGELATKQDRWGYVAALMGSVYIAVRAFDNLDKAFHPDKK